MGNRLFVLLFLFSFLVLGLQAQERPELLLQEGHTNRILDLAVSSDGLEAYTASEDGTVKVWDLPERRVKRTIYDVEESVDRRAGKTPLREATISVELGLAATFDNSSTLRVFDLSTGENLAMFRPGVPVDRLVLEGDLIYVAHSKGLVVYDRTGQQLKTLDPSDAWDDQTLSISQGILSLVEGDQLFFFDAKSLQPIFRHPLRPLFSRRSLSSMAGRLSPDGKKFALGTGYKILVIEVESGKILCASKPLEEYGLKPSLLSTEDFIPPGESNPTIFFPCWIDSDVAVWARGISAGGADDLMFRTLDDKVEVLDLDHVHLQPACANSDGLMLVPFDLSGQVAIFESGQQSGALEAATSRISDFDFHADTALLFVAGDGQVHTWDVKSGTPGRSYSGAEGLVWKIDVSPGGNRLLGQTRDSVVVWDVTTGEVLSRYPVRLQASYQRVEVVSFVDDSLYLYSESDKGVAYLVDATTGKVRDTRNLGPKNNELAVFNRSRTRVASYNIDKSITEWSPLIERDRLTVPFGSKPTSMAYLADGKTLLIATAQGSSAVLSRWEYDRTENEPEEWLSLAGGSILNIKENPDRSLVLLLSKGTIVELSREGCVTARRQLKDVSIYDSVEVDDSLLLVSEAAGTIAAYDPERCILQGEFVQFDQGQSWVAFTEDGRFDGNEQGMKKIDFELDGQLYGLSQFFNDYYTPGLLTEVFASKKEPAADSSRALTVQTLKKPPLVEITSPASGSTLTSSDLQVEVSVLQQGSGASNVSLFLNGHRIPETATQQVDETTYRFTVKAVKGINDITASAYDKTGTVESRQDRIRVKAPHIQARPPRLHLLSVGVDEYESGMSLRFAEEDATSINQLFQTELYEPGQRLLLSNEKAARTEILKAIEKIATEAEPQDALVVYLAGHGTVVGDLYYFLPSDTDVTSDQSLSTSAISSELLAQKLSQVPATKQLLVLDSCRSGAAAGAMSKYLAARSGLEEIRSQQMLARTSGVFLIAATKGEEYAYEIPELGHGVLTYAILNALGMSGENVTRATTANDLLKSVSTQVPELSEKFHGVRQQVIQWSSGQDFPLLK